MLKYLCSPPKGNPGITYDLKAVIKGKQLSTAEPVTRLGVIFSGNANWTTHTEDVLRVCFAKYYLRH